MDIWIYIYTYVHIHSRCGYAPCALLSMPIPISSPQLLDAMDHGAQEGMLSQEEVQAALRLQAILTLAQCR